MSVSGSRPADMRDDAFERGLRAQGAPQCTDDRLAELIRLIESTGGLASEPSRTGTPRAPEPRQASDPAPDGRGEMTPVEADAPAAFQSGDRPSQEGGDPPTRRPALPWMLKASALVLAGSALLGAGFGVLVGKPGAPPVVAGAEHPASAPQPSSEPAAPAGEAKAISPGDVQPASVNVAASGQEPTDIDAHVPPGDRLQPPAIAATPAAPAEPANGASAEPSPEAPIGAAAAANGGSAQPASPARGGNPDETLPSSVTDMNRPAHAGDAPREPPKQTAKAESAPVAAARWSPPKADLTVTPPRRPRPVVAKADSPARFAGTQPPGEPPRLEATIIAPPAPAEAPPAPPAPQTTTPASPLTALTQPLAPLAHAFNTVAGALGRGAPTAQPAAQPAPSRSDEWAVQFAAPKSAAQAATEAARLNARYGRALNGAMIGVHKTQANGETVYALRASGLTKAEAAVLCDRVKGHDCSIAK